MQAIEKLKTAMDKAMKRLEKSLKIMKTLRKHIENTNEERTWVVYQWLGIIFFDASELTRAAA